jgi:hypothetical protein
MSEADRLRFALKHLRPSDWEAFESLCGSFLANDFPELRTIAGIGDRGRDAIFFGNEKMGMVVQYSIQADWASKIRRTIERLKKAGVTCHTLIYATNRQIGAKADGLKTELLGKGIGLDVRDNSYFLDRVGRSENNRIAAERLSARVVDPILPTTELARNSPIDNDEMRAGLVYLELQLRDSSQARNLTKVSYESLVLGALADTDPENRRTQDDVVAAVQHHVPTHDEEQVKNSVEGALLRLKQAKKIVVSGPAENRAYALHHQERSRQADRAIEILAEREAVRNELEDLLGLLGKELEIALPESDLDALVDTLDSLLQSVLEKQGHRFADAVRTQQGSFRDSELRPIVEGVVVRHFKDLRYLKLSREELVDLTLNAALLVFVSPSPAVNLYLRDLSDAYTLLAFMHETPDVQKAVAHFFSKGTLVLDTTVLLPCFAETSAPAKSQRFTNLLRSAKEAGMSLYATEGVANEIDTHLQRALHCSRSSRGEWEGDIPFALAHWQELTGGEDFAKFVEAFRGKHGPDDIQQFLEQGLGIFPVDLNEAAERALPERDRHVVTELWRQRKRIRPGGSEMERDLLLRHDIEMYLGVIAQRRAEKRDVFGYESWWVTQDRTAQGIFRTARGEGIAIPSNPCMSPAFLSNLLSLGPARARLANAGRSQLPVALDIQRRGWADIELSNVANEIREEHAGDPEWLIRRHIRDSVNALKEAANEMVQDNGAH